MSTVLSPEMIQLQMVLWMILRDLTYARCSPASEGPMDDSKNHLCLIVVQLQMVLWMILRITYARR